MLLHEYKWKEVAQAREPVLVDFWAPGAALPPSRIERANRRIARRESRTVPNAMKLGRILLLQ
jgi:hypothetical protein